MESREVTKRQSDAQRVFCELACDKGIALYAGGLQGGKSVAGVDALEALLYGKKISLPSEFADLTPEVWVLAPSFNLVKVARGYVMWRMSIHIYTDRECRLLELKRDDAHTLWLRPNIPDGKPIRMVFRTSSDPDDLRGAGNLLAVLWDEAAYGKEESWLVIQGRMIASRGHILLTTTPRGKNWLYHTVYLPGTADPKSPAFDPSIGVVHSRSVDNPWADQKYLQQLRAKFGPDYSRQELDALFIAFEGYVYDFDRSRHLAAHPAVDTLEKSVAGFDPGFADPACVLFMGLARGVWHVLDEIYVTKKTTNELAPLLRAKAAVYKPSVWWCDPHRPSDIKDLRALGFDAKAALEPHGEDGRRTIMPGIRRVQGLLDSGRLLVHPSCEWTIEEFQNYAFPDRESKNRGENPVDFKNHAMDALRYAMVSEEGINHNARSLYWNSTLGKMMPRNKRQPARTFEAPDIEDSLAEQDKAMDAAEKRAGRWK